MGSPRAAEQIAHAAVLRQPGSLDGWSVKVFSGHSIPQRLPPAPALGVEDSVAQEGLWSHTA